MCARAVVLCSATVLMDGLYVCVFAKMASGCGMTAAGAKCVASWLAGNPPLQFLSIAGELTHAGVGEDAWMTMFGFRQ